MKNLVKIISVLIFSLTSYSYSQEEHTNREILNEQQEVFATKTIEIFEVLTTEYFPRKDVKFTVFKNPEGILFAKYEVIGKQREKYKWDLLFGNNLLMMKG